MHNSNKRNGWCNNHKQKYFAGSQLSKTSPFIGSPQGIIYRLSNHHSSTSIAVIRIIYFTVLCVYVLVLYLLDLKWLFTNLFHSTFEQRIVIHMHMSTCSHQIMVTETSKTTNFKACFFFYWLTTPFISIIFFYWQVYFQRVKATNETTTLLAYLFYNTILYWLTNLAINITFL